jgi:hypothetical protein
MERFLNPDANIIPDHQTCQLFAVYQDNASRNPLSEGRSGRREKGRGDKDPPSSPRLTSLLVAPALSNGSIRVW